MNLADIKGIGADRLKKLNNAGFFTPQQLLLYFPIKYLDTRTICDIFSAQSGDSYLISAKTNTTVSSVFVRGLRISRQKATTPEGTSLNLIWFNKPYVASNIDNDTQYLFYGKIKKRKNSIELINPIYERADNQKLFGNILPQYRAIKGIAAGTIRQIIKQIFLCCDLESFFPDELQQKYGLLPIKDAVFRLHFPQNFDELDAAQQTMTLHKLSTLILTYKILSKNAQTKRLNFYKSDDTKINSLVASLPFDLTQSQVCAFEQITEDLLSENKMNRILCGDVGSGKTIIAFLAMYLAFLNGYQSAIMAPTEILAVQHYQNAKKLFDKLGIKTVLLTSSLNAAQKQEVLSAIKSGQANFIVGTHSLIQKDAQFCALSLVVVDEQHKFGVGQRNMLEGKALQADMLIMSATPIPRTLSLVLYGDLQISTISQRPNKAQVNTNFVPEGKIDDMYGYITQQIAQGKQAYIVCARIEDNDDEIISAKELFDTIRQKYLKNVRAALIHGKLKDAKKTKIMADFAAGKIDVLISTTVIEVGIDVKNASIMVIYNAERFGLSQIHQLRGRIGRGTEESHCFLICRNKTSKERLLPLKSISNGFELAELDYKTRGAGDFIGTRQHGDAMIGEVSPMIVERAKELAQDLQGYQSVLDYLKQSLSDDSLSLIKKVTLN